jgi:hypothetical protein
MKIEKKDNEELMKFLEYEIRSSRVVPFISWEWLQNIAANYYANKAIKKYKRYKKIPPTTEQVSKIYEITKLTVCHIGSVVVFSCFVFIMSAKCKTSEMKDSEYILVVLSVFLFFMFQMIIAKNFNKNRS